MGQIVSSARTRFDLREDEANLPPIQVADASDGPLLLLTAVAGVFSDIRLGSIFCGCKSQAMGGNSI